jgi:formylglycine-generating enzyme required for sulfatase activity
LYDCEGFRLPTEAEWEYAARAGTRTAFYAGGITAQGHWGGCCLENALEPVAWYCNNAQRWTHPVASKKPNLWGLYDMLGNAAEWTNDPPVGSTAQGPLVDYGAVLSQKDSAVLRGGESYGIAAVQRAAADTQYFSRNYRHRGANLGLRLVRSLPLADTGG